MNRSGARRAWRWSAYVVAALVGVVLLYAGGRLLHVAAGSWYHGARGPYLQMLSDTAVTLRWQSAEAYVGALRYGRSPQELNREAVETAASEAHELRISGLRPSTRYYYSVGSQGRAERGADSNSWFVTAPPVGQAQPTRVWVIGDAGQPGPDQQAVRDAMLGWVARHPRSGRPGLDLWLTLGDNAYRSGTNEQFQRALFEPYAAILRNVVLWPGYGNHDARRWAFFEIFSLPTRAEAGGVASGSEHFYSFDYGNIHFVFLDSMDSDRDDDGDMMRWLKRDLAATRQPWLIAVFHHPPYSRGTHHSDNSFDSGGRMRDMRTRFLPVLEVAGVDLVLSGHSHMYERSKLLACHYGTSNTLREPMLRNRAGDVAEPSLYRKQAAGLAPRSGTVYVVLGSSARVDEGPLDHPAMRTALREMGSLIIDVNGARLEARLIDRQMQIRDSFAIVKGEVGGVGSLAQCP